MHWITGTRDPRAPRLGAAAADAMGNIFGAEVGPMRLMKYIRN
jgi:hypothetical protein